MVPSLLIPEGPSFSSATGNIWSCVLFVMSLHPEGALSMSEGTFHNETVPRFFFKKGNYWVMNQSQRFLLPSVSSLFLYTVWLYPVTVLVEREKKIQSVLHRTQKRHYRKRKAREVLSTFWDGLRVGAKRMNQLRKEFAVRRVSEARNQRSSGETHSMNKSMCPLDSYVWFFSKLLLLSL